MNIGEAAEAAGVSARMIRHYEATGLVPRPPRGASGYRRYAREDVARLRFVRNARDAGFGLAEIGRLLALWHDRQRPAREVKRLVAAHLEDIEARIAGLARIRDSLAHLVEHCRADERPACPILEAFEAPPAAPRGPSSPPTR